MSCACRQSSWHHIRCVSDRTELRHTRLTRPMATRLGKKIDRRAREWWSVVVAQRRHDVAQFLLLAQFCRVRVESNTHVRVQRLPSCTFVLTDMLSGSARGSLCTSWCFLYLRPASCCWTCPECTRIIIITISISLFLSLSRPPRFGHDFDAVKSTSCELHFVSVLVCSLFPVVFVRISVILLFVCCLLTESGQVFCRIIVSSYQILDTIPGTRLETGIVDEGLEKDNESSVGENLQALLQTRKKRRNR